MSWPLSVGNGRWRSIRYRSTHIWIDGFLIKKLFSFFFLFIFFFVVVFWFLSTPFWLSQSISLSLSLSIAASSSTQHEREESDYNGYWTRWFDGFPEWMEADKARNPLGLWRIFFFPSSSSSSCFFSAVQHKLVDWFRALSTFWSDNNKMEEKKREIFIPFASYLQHPQ